MFGSPNPWSGTVMHVDRERLEPIEADFAEVMRRLRMVGHNSSTLLPARDAERDRRGA